MVQRPEQCGLADELHIGDEFGINLIFLQNCVNNVKVDLQGLYFELQSLVNKLLLGVVAKESFCALWTFLQKPDNGVL